MFLLTSAAYIRPGLASEFGKLPPCMLPVQNRRLYEHQIVLALKKEQVVLSLPQSYRLTCFDERRLALNNVKVVYVPDNLSLGQSVVYVLNVCGHYDQPIRILHGDTLFSSISDDLDVCSVDKAEEAYDWASADQNDERIYSGYFSFSDQSLLIRKITESHYNFIEGIEKYGKVRKITYQKFPNWMDFSLVNSYYRSIAKLTTQRVFNSMVVTRYSVIKSSTDKKKMNAEANWLLSIPTPMKHYVPALWSRGENEEIGFYELEYYYLSSLANLFVFGNNKLYVWKEIIDACCLFINDEIKYRPDNPQVVALQNNHFYADKTLSRLTEYAKQLNVDLNHSWIINDNEAPSLMEIIRETDGMISKNDEEYVSLMHGDPCFSNILYDFKSKSIKIIDPRGIDHDGNISIYGDLRYDVAKLAHSVLGLYDFIIAGMFEYKEYAPYHISLIFETNDLVIDTQEYFSSKEFGAYNLSTLSTYPIMIHLFLSMLPLHYDYPERQKAMLANALRLYIEMKKK